MNKVENKSILIVEDDKKLRDVLTEYFSAVNDVTPCGTLSSAVDAVREKRYDVVLLDIILPDGYGLKLIDYTEDTPIVILSDLNGDANILEGFSAGAADYIVKPASPAVIEARMSLRLLPDGKATVASHGLTLNIAKRTAIYKGHALDFTSSEFNIIAFLMRNGGKFFTASEIYEQVWEMPYLKTETIKKHISNLRKKMFSVSEECASLIISEFGKGYAFIGD